MHSLARTQLAHSMGREKAMCQVVRRLHWAGRGNATSPSDPALESVPDCERQSVVVVWMRRSNILPDWQADGRRYREAAGGMESRARREPEALSTARLFDLAIDLLPSLPFSGQLDEGIPRRLLTMRFVMPVFPVMVLGHLEMVLIRTKAPR